jgi:uncharacterized surface protein with fasciclin (FAS1) repeats
MLRKFVFLLAIAMIGIGSVQAQNAQPGATLRVVHLSADAGALDIALDDQPVSKGLFYPNTSDPASISAGQHTITFTPSNALSRESNLPSASVQAQDGSSYIVALIGSTAGSSLQAVVIDETSAYATANLETAGERDIILNALNGAPDVDFYFGSEPRIQKLGFGKVAAVNFPQRAIQMKVVESQNQTNVLYQWDSIYGLPNNTSLLAMIGAYPDQRDVFITNYSPLPLMDFLAGFNTYKALSFSSFLSALQTARLDKTLSGTGRYTLFAPDNVSIGSLPAGAFDSLLQDPKALSRVLRTHIVPEYVTSVDLATRADAKGVTTLTSLDGTPLTIARNKDGIYVINDSVQILAADFMAQNGVAHLIDGVIGVSQPAPTPTPTQKTFAPELQAMFNAFAAPTHGRV